MKKKFVLALSGGGFKGGFQIGALDYILNHKITLDNGEKVQIEKFDIITGVSVGSLNGVFVAANKFEKLKGLWAKIIASIIVVTMLDSCVSIPRETLLLSQTLGKDLKELHNSHRNMVQLYYTKIKDNVNVFIDEVYSPYIINYMLKAEMQGYRNGEASLYKAIEDGGKLATPEATESAMSYMQDFLEIVKSQIEEKRESLLSPIEIQERELLNKINQSYENVLLANASITNYLKSIRKLKEAQQDVLAMVGLSGADTTVINSLMTVSEKVNEAVKAGKKIDLESDKALEEIDKITQKIKQLTTKK